MLELQAFTALSMKCRTTHHKESPAEESPFFILGLTYREKKMKKQTLLLLRGAILLLLVVRLVMLFISILPEAGMNRQALPFISRHYILNYRL